MYDPDGLKKSLPARLMDDDPRCSPLLKRMKRNAGILQSQKDVPWLVAMT